nr:MAG: NAD(P)/FAD-dependent oxidoreductase [Hyphomicrobiales bacterium]
MNGRHARPACEIGDIVDEKIWDVVIVGGGAAGIGTAASLLQRRSSLSIAIIEPRDSHYYQPGWTMVGAGIFDAKSTERTERSVMPANATWIKASAASFTPGENAVVLDDGEKVFYRSLVVAPGLKLDWNGVEGVSETLGKNGVTSNYTYETAPYTWQLVQGLKSGRALFTQPAMPIKCAGAPQKALYLSCDHWLRSNRLNDIAVEFHLATPALFGVKEYVPALMEYVTKYGIELNFGSRLIKVDSAAKKAWFERIKDGNKEVIERDYDMIHVCPPQTAPDFIRNSPLADAAGWVDVNQETLRHKRYANVFSLGDACNTPNAKTAAAVQKQAPIAAVNILNMLEGKTPEVAYDGYGSCPLTVERGKIVLAEFGYGGKLLPTFPVWLIDGTRPTKLAWELKVKILPSVYWNCLLKGREWFVKPTAKLSQAAK